MADVERVLQSVLTSFIGSIKVDDQNAPPFMEIYGLPQADCPMTAALDYPGAVIIIQATGRAWNQIAYQFGHELGHVLCNTWGSSESIPLSPSHWLEEALVESFSLFGLKRMAQEWRTTPPYPHWQEYAEKILTYSKNILSRYSDTDGSRLFRSDGPEWLKLYKDELEASLSLTSSAKQAVPWLSESFISNPHLIRSLPAMNKWHGRGSLPLANFIQEWVASCRRMGYPDILPLRIGNHLF